MRSIAAWAGDRSNAAEATSLRLQRYKKELKNRPLKMNGWEGTLNRREAGGPLNRRGGS